MPSTARGLLRIAAATNLSTTTPALAHRVRRVLAVRDYSPRTALKSRADHL